ncbi:hypothetical protein PGQ11_012154 [Apiospora arundinis]|uniref:Uncharacterized protein n=1 Tax=Apiospora arundinis TaxID=335852 RepID=A0ABR2I244_9PEZI
MTTLRPDNPRSESNSSQNLLLDNRTGTNSGYCDGWKPWTLKTPALACLFLITLVLAAVVEFLYHKSQKQGGGLALSESPGDLPPLVNLAYLYLPTIIAVAYSLLWGWVASDTKRLQPWLEMSKPEGALAENSLLLDYPATFFAWVPFMAASRRHWPVFLSGMIVVLVSFAITPLQSAILKLERLTINTDAPFLVTSRLPPVSSQSRRMDTMLMNSAYATTFLGQLLPPFTARDFALLPAKYQGGPAMVKKDTNFTVATTKLSTSLECWPATVAYDERVGDRLSNGRGCTIDVPLDNNSPYSMYYIGWDTNSWSEYGLKNQPHICPSENSHQVLLVWAKGNTSTRQSGGQMEWTASFCETRYWKQPVLVSLSSNESVLHDEHIDSIQPLGTAEILDDRDFNITAFERFLSIGEPPDMEEDTGKNIQKDEHIYLYRVNSDRRFKGIGLQHTISNMLGFALGDNVADLSVYKNPERLTKTFEAMHQLLFSLAVSRINSLETSPNMFGVTGIAKVSRYGITVSRRFAIAVESLLLVVAVLTICLLLSCRRYHNKLLSDPDSIRTVAGLAKQSSVLRKELSEIGARSHDEIRKTLNKQQFCLRVVEGGKEVQLDIINPRHSTEENSDPHHSPLYTPDVPSAMQPLSGLVFALILVAALSYLAYLKVIERRSQGLRLPMNNQLALEILENYIPVVFATLIEALWVLLNRLLATIQPYTELYRGQSPGAKSIDLKYTSLPPQLLVWKAVKARHPLLGLVCIISILANGLSVSLGGLFNELPVIEDEAVEVSMLQTPSITNSSLSNLIKAVDSSSNAYSDHFNIANVHYTTGTRLPPWLTEEYYFLPFGLEHILNDAAESYTARSHGVTVRPSCKPLAHTSLVRNNIAPPQFEQQATNTEPLAPSDISWLKCVNATLLVENSMNRTGNLASEIHLPSNQCTKAYIRAWVRGTTNPGDTLIKNLEITGVACQPTFTTAEFNLTVDNTGRVLQANRVSDFRPFEWGPGNGSDVRHSLEKIAFDYLIPYSPETDWYNNTNFGDTLGYLQAQRNNSFTDPQKPLADTNKILSETEIVMKMLTVALFQQNPTIFETATNSTPNAQGTRRITVTKIFMADVAFVITMVLLSLNVVTAMIVYCFGPTPFLPRFPDTIGSVLGYVAKSRLTELDWGAITANNSEEEGGRGEKTPEHTFSFGRYTDREGKEHLGIDVDPFVVKVDREGNPEWHGYDTKTPWLARLRGRKSRNHESDDYNES